MYVLYQKISPNTNVLKDELLYRFLLASFQKLKLYIILIFVLANWHQTNCFS